MPLSYFRPFSSLYKNLPGVDFCPALTFSLLNFHQHFCHSLPDKFHLFSLPGQRRTFQVRKIKKKIQGFRIIFSLRYNLSNFYTTPVKFHGVEFQGPVWAPTRLFPNIANFSFVLIVPVLYGAIFRFRKKHTTTTLGGDQL